MSSLRLRDLSCAMLDQRGCVCPQWERIREEGGGKIRWRVAYHVRAYSKIIIF